MGNTAKIMPAKNSTDSTRSKISLTELKLLIKVKRVKTLIKTIIAFLLDIISYILFPLNRKLSYIACCFALTSIFANFSTSLPPEYFSIICSLLCAFIERIRKRVTKNKIIKIIVTIEAMIDIFVA